MCTEHICANYVLHAIQFCGRDVLRVERVVGPECSTRNTYLGAECIVHRTYLRELCSNMQYMWVLPVRGEETWRGLAAGVVFGNADMEITTLFLVLLRNTLWIVYHYYVLLKEILTYFLRLIVQ